MAKQQLARLLKARHLSMMALGGTIGTGLLLASGSAIYSGGPGGAILGYTIVGVLVYFLMTSLGEMAAFSPTTGSFCEYASKYVDKAFGFTMGWNYWVNWVLVIASEILAAGLVMQFWFPGVPIWTWTLVFFALIVLLNLFAVRVYGEAEYWMAFIKISTVIIFIVVGVLSIFGLVGSHGPVGFQNITLGDGPFHAGFMGFLGVFFVAGYSFQGAELVGIAAGEANNPQHSLPKAVKRIFWRILLFYVLAITVISFLIPYTNPLLVNANSDVAVSPFTLVFQLAGFKYAASLMNLVVITSIVSTANASLYTASRVLWHLGNAKEGPAFLRRLDRRSVPVVSVLISAAFCFLFAMLSFWGSGVIFSWLVNLVSLAGYIAWFGICLSHYRFRRAYVLQGYDMSKLPYRASWFPFAPIFTMVMIVLIMIGQQVMLYINGGASWLSFLETYGGVILFLAVLIGYKVFFKTKLIPLNKCVINSTGL